jgi:HYR domain
MSAIQTDYYFHKGFLQNALFIGLLLLFSFQSFGQQYQEWTGAVSSDWFTAGNWDNDMVPNSSTYVGIRAAINIPVINGSSAICLGVNVYEGSVLNITNSGTLNITFYGINSYGIINNSGTINLDGDQSYIGIYNANIFNNNASGRININNLNTSSSGILTVSGSSFVNNGNVSINAPLNIVFNGITNKGTFSNNSGGQINIDGVENTGIVNEGTFNNQALIKIGSVASVGNRGIENDATFNNSAGGQISIDRVSLGISNTNHTGPSTFNNFSILNIGETVSAGYRGIFNAATFNNNSGGQININRVLFQGIYTQKEFNNQGTINIGNIASGGNQGIHSLSTFNNKVGGQININRTVQAAIYVSENYDNFGTLINFNNESTITIGAIVPSSIMVDGSNVHLNNKIGGIFRGSGSINSDVFFNIGGALSPEFAPSVMSFSSAEDFTNSILDIDITGNGGVSGIDYDKIRVSSGSATIGASTLVNLTFSTATVIGDYYDIISANSLIGTISPANINITNIGAGNVGEVSISYPNNNTVRITVIKYDCALTTLPSNLTMSACINQEDYQNWLHNHGGAVLDCNAGNYIWNWEEYDYTTTDCPTLRGWSVRFTVSDANGIIASASATVSIIDEDTPQWVTSPTNLTIPCNATNVDATIKAWLTNTGGASVFDCGGYTLTNNYSAAANCGATQVTFTATDRCGHSATATAVLSRDLPPIFSNVPPNTTISCPATPSFASPTATACGGAATITFTDVTNGTACPAMHTVTRTWVAQDACGNTSSAKSKVTVWPEIAPTGTVMTVNCANSFLATAAVGATSAIVNYPVPSGTSTCPLNTVTVTQVTGLASGAVFPLGVSLVTYAITDECDHIRYCSFTVIVQPSPAQTNSTLTLACSANKVVTAATGAFSAVVPYTAPTATSTCAAGGATVTLESGLASGATFPMGVTTVVYRATDACGNTATCSFTVTVNAGQPVQTNGIKLSCSSDITAVAAAGATSAVVNYSAPTGNSVCPMSGFSVTLVSGLASGSAFPIGVSTVTYKATTNCGNERFCSFTVTVSGVQPLIGNNGDAKEINPNGEISDEVQNTNAQDRNAAIDKNKLSENSFKIYPNPSSNRLFIESKQLDGLIGAKYEVFDNVGRVVVSGNIMDNLTDLDISRLAVGHFTMRIAQIKKPVVLRFEKF